jgi:hypothetical protein
MVQLVDEDESITAEPKADAVALAAQLIERESSNSCVSNGNATCTERSGLHRFVLAALCRAIDLL